MGEFIIRINRKTFAMKIEGEGFTGTECLGEADKIQDALGVRTISEDLKEEIALTDINPNISR